MSPLPRSWRAPLVGLAALALAWTGLAPTAAAAAPLTSPRIVNGTGGDPAAFPYVVALLAADRFAKEGAFQAQFCGGTLTTPTTVVTAAHCVVDQRTGDVRTPQSTLVSIGADLSAADLRVVKVASVTVNPDYSRRTASNDVAVLTLAEPVADVPVLQPVSPDEALGLIAPGASVQVVGWGNTSSSAKLFPDVYRVGRLVIFPDGSCGSGEPFQLGTLVFKGYTSDDADARVMVCASGITDDARIVDSCQGDSGGPLIAGDGPAARLVGLVSWGEECASEFPGVYTRLSSQYDFLVAQHAVGVAVPTAAPAITVSGRPSALFVTFQAAADGSTVTGFAANAVDPATGAVASCFAAPRPDGLPSSCLIPGLTDGTTYQVTAIAGTADGNSPVAGPVDGVPAEVPAVGRITKVTVSAKGVLTVRVTASAGSGSALTSVRVACLPVSAGGGPKSAAVQGKAAVISGLRAGTYACVLRATNAVGTATSAAVLVRR